ncbi:MAG: cytochrome c oxidase subunit I [Chloroflexota bacterium]|nr:cytochrome c oxidase subunit I [Chloroflexota bacterium]
MSEISLAPESTSSLPRQNERQGLFLWIASVDHKQIGIMYLVAAMFFLVVGGLEALLLRLQLAQPNAQVLSPWAYNQLFTMHGTTMIFLALMPMLIGFGNYLVPLMIGASDMAFPRLNALGLWLLVFGGLLLYYSFVDGGAPDAGWFAYAPLSDHDYTSTEGVTYWAFGLLVTGIGSVVAAINFIVTIITMRAAGLTMRRLPLFVWMTLVTACLILFALPLLNAGLVMLLADRLLAAHFFVKEGSPILWQHVFWSFGHPEVYILILPAFGMISEIIPVFSRKPIFGYGFVAGSTVAIGFFSFAVWAHHMFAVGLGFGWNAFMGFSTMLISIPTGIKIFSWIATMWGGALRFTTAMLFAIGFLITFTIGGITGVTFAIVPTDWLTTDTYYVVAHLHYVLVGGTQFALYAGIYYWFPKMTGRLLSETWGKWHFWLNFGAFNLTFFVQHFLGVMGMPRRVYTYPDLPGWGELNLLSSIGGLLSALATLVFMINIVMSVRRGAPAGDNPWDAWTLEWATTSPPPPHNFDRLPLIRSRRPLWDLAHPEDPDWLHGH